MHAARTSCPRKAPSRFLIRRPSRRGRETPEIVSAGIMRGSNHLSANWHATEKFLKVKGSEKRETKKERKKESEKEYTTSWKLERPKILISSIEDVIFRDDEFT